MNEQMLEENELDEERELIIEEEVEEEAEEAVEIQETSSIEVPCSLKEEGYKELVEAAFEHAKDTMKEKDKIDWFVLGCGLFAIVCLGISVVNVVRYGFDWLFGVMMAAYVIVAVFCLCRKIQYKIGRAYWNSSFKGKTKAGRKEPTEISFSEAGITYKSGKKEITRAYDTFWDTYVTEKYYVFHVADRCIVPISKTDVDKAQEDYDGIDLHTYFSNLCEKYKRVLSPEAEQEAEDDEDTEDISKDDAEEENTEESISEDAEEDGIDDSESEEKE